MTNDEYAVWQVENLKRNPLAITEPLNISLPELYETFRLAMNRNEAQLISRISEISVTEPHKGASTAFMVATRCATAEKPYFVKTLWEKCLAYWTPNELDRMLLQNWECVNDQRGITFLLEDPNLINSELVNDLYFKAKNDTIRFFIVKAILKSANQRGCVKLTQRLWVDLTSRGTLDKRELNTLDVQGNHSGISRTI